MDSPDRVRQPETVARVLSCGNRKVRPGARSVGRGGGVPEGASGVVPKVQ
eukprot:COSAG05_NODE_714_length_7813_cov_41.624060_4_plen_50_part_00